MVFNKKGFTLIELITVIAIIAIISGGLIYLSPKLITRQRLKMMHGKFLMILKKFKREQELNLKD